VRERKLKTIEEMEERDVKELKGEERKSIYLFVCDGETR